MPITQPIQPWQMMVLQDWCDENIQVDEVPEILQDISDSLLRFVLTELDPSEGCNTLQEAQKRYERVVDDLREWGSSLKFASIVAGPEPEENDNEQG